MEIVTQVVTTMLDSVQVQLMLILHRVAQITIMFIIQHHLLYRTPLLVSPYVLPITLTRNTTRSHLFMFKSVAILKYVPNVTFIWQLFSLCVIFPAPPTLTLWVGLASGHIAAYTVSIKRPENVGFGPPQRILKIKVIPIRMQYSYHACILQTKVTST